MEIEHTEEIEIDTEETNEDVMLSESDLYMEADRFVGKYLANTEPEFVQYIFGGGSRRAEQTKLYTWGAALAEYERIIAERNQVIPPSIRFDLAAHRKPENVKKRPVRLTESIINLMMDGQPRTISQIAREMNYPTTQSGRNSIYSAIMAQGEKFITTKELGPTSRHLQLVIRWTGLQCQN